MIENLIAKIDQYNLMDWGVILLGVVGVPSILDRLTIFHVREFAEAELDKISNDNPDLDIYVSLATSDVDTPHELRCYIEKICEVTGIDIEISKRKWRWVSLESLLSDLDLDPIYGMIKLSEFWSAWQWPIDAPISMQNGVNDISPENYHSQLHYESVIHDHRDWLTKELTLLSRS